MKYEVMIYPRDVKEPGSEDALDVISHVSAVVVLENGTLDVRTSGDASYIFAAGVWGAVYSEVTL